MKEVPRSIAERTVSSVTMPRCDDYSDGDGTDDGDNSSLRFWRNANRVRRATECKSLAINVAAHPLPRGSAGEIKEPHEGA